MLTFHSTAANGEIHVERDAPALPPGVNWIDALRPNRVDAAAVKRLLGFDVPSFESLSQIETSRRIYRRGDLLFMTMPMIVRLTSGLAETSPIGFVLARDFVLTARYKHMKACENLQHEDGFASARPATGVDAWIKLVESIIDECSDELENINAQLDGLSQTVFDQGLGKARRSKGENSAELRGVLGAIAGCGNLDSKIDDVLLGLARMLPFVASEAAAYLAPEEKARIKSLGRDIASLKEYGRVQSERIGFLLNATLGLTNVEQNNIFRLLTVVSVIGIPPTLVASIYGMNFKYMPELEWGFGYEWGLGLILISALIPAIWFKRRGWW